MAGTGRPIAPLHNLFTAASYHRVVRARRVLVVEDDVKTSASIEMYLRHEGYQTDVAYSGTDGLTRARQHRPDLVVLDVMLPGTNGVEVCRALRADGPVPVILLTARSTEGDKLLGLDAGADDYVTKPFSPRELMARIRAVLRRTEPSVEPVVVGDVVLDPARREVRVRGSSVSLTAGEFRLLEVLMRAPGRVFTREELIERAFGGASEAMDRTIDAHIKNLRRKIEPDRGNPSYIVTVFGAGYRFA